MTRKNAFQNAEKHKQVTPASSQNRPVFLHSALNFVRFDFNIHCLVPVHLVPAHRTLSRFVLFLQNLVRRGKLQQAVSFFRVHVFPMGMYPDNFGLVGLYKCLPSSKETRTPRRVCATLLGVTDTNVTVRRHHHVKRVLARRISGTCTHLTCTCGHFQTNVLTPRSRRPMAVIQSP